MKKILFIITLLLIGISNVNAEPCDAYDIKRLKEIANGVEITYELLPPVEGLYSTEKDYYKINITGLTDELIVINEEDNEFYYNNTNFDETKALSSGKKKLVIKAKKCARILKNVTLKLPVYNSYHEHELCQKKENKDLNVCQEWVEEYVDAQNFLDATTKQNDENNNSNNFFIINYKLLIVIAMIILIALIIFMVLKKKKEELK